MKSKADVIVVGGGPAGCASALGLARRGYAVTLLDRARFPRDKACGEFLTPQACQLFADLGLWEEVMYAGARPVAATTLIAPNGETLRHTPSSGKPAGYTIRRVVLDALLLNAARRSGVDVREGFSVRTLLQGEHGEVCGITGQNADGDPETLSAKLVIGADGSHSLVARQLGLVRPLPRLQRVAIISHWRNVSGTGDAIEMRSRENIVCGVSYPREQDNGGVKVLGVRENPNTPIPNASITQHPNTLTPNTPMTLSCNLTLVVPTTFASQIAGRKADFIEQTLTQHFPDVGEKLAAAERETAIRTIGCFGHRCKSAAFDGGMLVGDAATFIDPFTGEGVYFALRGAELSVETAETALHTGDYSLRTLARYNNRRAELRQRYLLCDIIGAVIRRPALATHAIVRLKGSPDAADRLLSIVGDIRHPKEILHPHLLWRLLVPDIRG